MHCLLPDWEVLSFANMLLMWVNMLQRQAAGCLSEYLSRTSAGKEKETRVVQERPHMLHMCI